MQKRYGMERLVFRSLSIPFGVSMSIKRSAWWCPNFGTASGSERSYCEARSSRRSLPLAVPKLGHHRRVRFNRKDRRQPMVTSFRTTRQNLSTRFRLSILVAAFTVAALLLSFGARAARNQRDDQPPYRNPNLQVDQRVVDLLS